jgi:hypothetical protein
MSTDINIECGREVCIMQRCTTHKYGVTGEIIAIEPCEKLSMKYHNYKQSFSLIRCKLMTYVYGVSFSYCFSEKIIRDNATASVNCNCCVQV